MATNKQNINNNRISLLCYPPEYLITSRTHTHTRIPNLNSNAARNTLAHHFNSISGFGPNQCPMHCIICTFHMVRARGLAIITVICSIISMHFLSACVRVLFVDHIQSLLSHSGCCFSYYYCTIFFFSSSFSLSVQLFSPRIPRYGRSVCRLIYNVRLVLYCVRDVRVIIISTDSFWEWNFLSE